MIPVSKACDLAVLEQGVNSCEAIVVDLVTIF